MPVDSTAVILYDSNGVALAVNDGVAIPANTPALIVAGSDGANARYLKVDATGAVGLAAGVNVIGQVGIDPAANDVDVLTLPPVDQGTSPWVIAGAVTQGGAWVVDQGTSPWIVGDGGGSLTIDTPQLPAALVGGRLDTNIGSWFGSTVPTIGQKLAAASIPVVLASNQVLVVSTVSGAFPGGGPTGAAAQASAVQAGFVDASGLTRGARVYDTDSGGGTEFTVGVNLRRSGGGGSQELIGQATMANSVPVTIASDQSTVPVSSSETSTTGTLAALNATVTLVLGGRAFVGYDLDNISGGFVGTVQARANMGSGAFTATCFFTIRTLQGGLDVTDGTKVSSIAFSGAVVRVQGTLLIPAGAVSVEIRATAYTGGSLDVAAFRAGGVVGDEEMSSSILNAVLPPFATMMGASDGTNIQAPRVFDLDTGGGAQFVSGANLRRSGAGGSVELLGQTTMANSLPVVIASDQSSSFDLDTGGGTQNVVGVSLRKAAGGGSVELGTLADPVHVAPDPVGTLANGAQTTVDGTVGGVQILAANANRKKLIIQNVGSNNMRVGVTGVTNTTGFRLIPGAIWEEEMPYCPTNAIFAIREGATNTTALAQEIT